MRRFWWIVFLVFNAVLLTAFGLGYIARSIDPRSFWWPQLFAIALPQISILIAIIFPVLIYAKRWKLVTAHSIVIGLIIMRFWGGFAPSYTVPEGHSTLRLASYNLGHFEIFSQAEQAQKLGEIMGFLYPDVIGLQEFMVRYRGRILRIRNLPYVANKLDSLGFQTVASSRHEVSTTFKPIWTRKEVVEPLEKKKIVIGEPGYSEMSLNRMKFRWEGREALYYNVHLRTFGAKKPWLENKMSPLSPRFWMFYFKQYREAFEYRAWQAEKIKNMINSESLPVILSGDFNSTPHNWAYSHLAEGLTDAHAKKGSSWRTSFHVNFPLVKIDHMLLSSEWKVFKSNIPGLDYSDHRPLVAVVGWQE